MVSEEVKAVIREEVVAQSRGAFGSAVAQATANATQDVAAKNRRRLVWHGFLAGFLAAVLAVAAIGIPVTLSLTDISAAAGRRNVRRNCEAQASTRPQGNARAYAQLAFLRVLQDALVGAHGQPRSPQARAFATMELRQVNVLAKTWRPFTAVYGHVHGRRELVGNELPLRIKSFVQLAGRIHPVPLLDCDHVVRE